MGPAGREDGGASITVFVKGVSFAVDDKRFEEAFAEVGPIRTCFLVRKSGQDRHLGYGFVTYALLEDSKRAVEEMDGKDLGGRSVHVSFAKARGTLEERRQRASIAASAGTAPSTSKPRLQPLPQERKSKHSVPKGDKHKFVRTLVLGGLNDASKPAAIKKAKKFGKVEEFMDPAPDDILHQFLVHRDGCTGGCVLVVYEKAKDCMAAVAGLHRSAPGGSGKKGAKGDDQGLLWARQLSGEGLHLKKWRVIVRNLPFSISEEALRNSMDQGGFVWDLTLPTGPEGKSKGFAFVTYTCKAHAEEAIKKVNGTKISGRMVAVDWALAKKAYDQVAAASGGDEEEEANEEGNQDDGEGDSDDDLEDEDVEEDVDDGEDIAVENLEDERKKSLSLLDEVMAKADEQKVEGQKKGKTGNVKASKPDESEKTKKKDSGVEGPGAKQEAKKKPDGSVPGAAKINGAVFVRGLHLDVTKMDLQLKMERFGAVKSCRLVVDKDTKKPKGTAFIDFEEPSAAEKAVAACSKDKGASSFSINGMPIQIDHALTQDGARALATSHAEQGARKDKRNLYLSKEGVIQRGTPAWEGLSSADQTKRERAVEECKAKLKNPNMYCSTTRLLIRNVPKDFDDKALKDACLKMVLQRAKKAKPDIKHCKILMDAGDGSGVPRSRGRGFVEFGDHEHAMACLRQMNNNPRVFSSASRPIVEFAVEDARLKRKMDLKAKGRKHRGTDGGLAEGTVVNKAEKKKLWKNKLRDKITERKQKKQQGGAGNEPAGGVAKPGPEAEAAKKEPSKAASGNKRKAAATGDQALKKAKPANRANGKMTGKGKGGKHGDKDVGTAKEAIRAAKARRVQAQAVEEESHSTRKRKQEELIDKLANMGSAGEMRQRKKNKPKKDASDPLDKLVGEYTKKLFASDDSNKSSSHSTRKARLQRWFE